MTTLPRELLTDQTLDKVNPYRTLAERIPDKILVNRSQAPEAKDIERVQNFLQPFSDVYLEIGSGSGLHLLSLSRHYPHAACIGMELRFKRAYRTIEKAQQQLLPHIVVLRANGSYVQQIFPESSVMGVFINFPDPWDKRGWKKNRILSIDYLEHLATILQPKGFFAFKTDHQEYFDSVMSLISHSPLFHSKEESESKNQVPDFATEFELLFRSQNLPRYRIVAECIKRK